MGLDDPTAKMSKSSRNAGHAIFLLDTDEAIVKKIKSAKTDSKQAVDPSDLSPGVRNLIDIYSAFAAGHHEATLKEFDGVSYGALKTRVAEPVLEAPAPVPQPYPQIPHNPPELDAPRRPHPD